MDDLEIYWIAKMRLDRLKENPTIYDHIKEEIILEYQKLFPDRDTAIRAYIYSYSVWLNHEREQEKSIDYIY